MAVVIRYRVNCNAAMIVQNGVLLGVFVNSRVELYPRTGTFALARLSEKEKSQTANVECGAVGESSPLPIVAQGGRIYRHVTCTLRKISGSYLILIIA